MKIEFERFERECGKNFEVRETGKGKLIFDFRVLIDGEHRATFSRKVYATGYELRTPDCRHPIANPKASWAHHVVPLAARSQDSFGTLVEGWLAEGYVPTVEEEENRKLAEAEEARRSKRAEKTRGRKFKIQKAGPRLLAALFKCVREMERLEAQTPLTGSRFKAAISHGRREFETARTPHPETE